MSMEAKAAPAAPKPGRASSVARNMRIFEASSSTSAFSGSSSLILRGDRSISTKSALSVSIPASADTECTAVPPTSPVQFSIPRFVTTGPVSVEVVEPPAPYMARKAGVRFPEPTVPAGDGEWSCTQLIVPATQTKASIEGLGPCSFVLFRVIACNAIGYGLPSEFVQSFIPDAPLINDVTPVSVTVTFGKYRSTDLDRRFQSYELQYQVFEHDIMASCTNIPAPSLPAWSCPQPHEASLSPDSVWHTFGHDGLPPPVVVKGLTSATRYRFRYRIGLSSRTGTEWPDWKTTCPSVWVRTSGLPAVSVRA